MWLTFVFFFFFQAEDGIRDIGVTGVQTCALPILGLASLLSREPKETRKVPNQGANASARVALATVLIVAIAVGPLGGIFTGLILGLLGGRSEERRVGKECRCGGEPHQ